METIGGTTTMTITNVPARQPARVPRMVRLSHRIPGRTYVLMGNDDDPWDCCHVTVLSEGSCIVDDIEYLPCVLENDSWKQLAKGQREETRLLKVGDLW